MTRFLTILAAAAVAGVMYVATAPGGLRSAGPTARQFKALKTTVAKLQKAEAQDKKLSTEEAELLVGCLMHQAQAVDRAGTAGTSGYLFGAPNGGDTAAATTALDLAPTTETSSQFYFLAVSPSCVATINNNGGATAASRTGVLQQLAAQTAR